MTREESTLWVRLSWRAPERDGDPVRFFGQGVTQTDAEAESLLSFDQELCLEQRLRGREFEFDIFRTIEGGAAPPAFLRGGGMHVVGAGAVGDTGQQPGMPRAGTLLFLSPGMIRPLRL